MMHAPGMKQKKIRIYVGDLPEFQVLGQLYATFLIDIYEEVYDAIDAEDCQRPAQRVDPERVGR
jgi:hypothetical protein